MARYPGNIRKFPNSIPAQNSASGIWTMNEQIDAQRRGIWPPERDPYFNYTTLLVKGNVPYTTGINAMNKALAFNSDASTNNFLLTPNGDVSARPFNPYLNNYSNYLGGAGNYFQTPANSATTIVGTLSSTANLTIECWIFPTAYNSSANFPGLIGDMLATAENNNWSWGITNTGTLMLYWNISGTQYRATSASAVSLNTWTHIALNVSAGAITMYINGVSQTLSGTTTLGTPSSSNNYLVIGQWNNGSGGTGGTSNGLYTGYISNLRVVKASTYTSSFIPSTVPLTAIPNTSLLYCQSNRFKDNSSSPLTLTVTGSPAVSQNSPFVSYDTTSGSGYFDGTGDYLTAPDNAAFAMGTGDFTVECFIYTLSSSSTAFMILDTINADNDSTGFVIYRRATGKLTFAYDSGGFIAIEGATTINANTWYHVMVTRSSNSVRLFVNGNLDSSAVSVTNNFSRQANTRIAASWSDTNACFGYISSLRILKGTALQTASFSFPTAPLTAITNTSLLTLQTRAPANNQGILDTGPNNFLVTRNGNVAQGSFTPFSPTGWGNYFPSTAYLSIGTTAAFSFGTGDFTVEGWINTNDSSVCMFDARASNSATPWVLNAGSGSNTYWYDGTSYTSSIGITLGQWNHVAVARQSGVLRIFVNGQQGYSANHTVNQDRTAGIRIGQIVQTGQNWTGYLSNLRIVKGQALYTGVFTPPTTILATNSVGTTGANVAASITSPVSLLTAQSNRFVDNSSNNFALTGTNSPQVQAFSPFAPAQSYMPSQIGGSAYFDGTSDYLKFAVNQVPLALGNSDFTIEAWVYRLNTNTAGILVGQSDLNTAAGSSYVLYVSSSATSDVYSGSSGYGITSPNPGINEWAHVALVRTGGTYSSYLNGVRVGNRTDLSTATVNTGSTTYAPSVGGFSNSTSLLTGYISGLRLIKGSGGYNANDTNIVIPTAPPTAKPNTSLLLNFTNGGIVDATGKNNLETVANSGVQTSQAKWSLGSMYFDGTGDYLVAPSSQFWTFGSTEDFTIEFWFYTSVTVPISGSTPSTLISNYPDWNIWTNRWAIATNDNKIKWYDHTGNAAIASNNFTYSVWNHVAVVRSSSSIKMYINGTQEGSTQTTNQTYTSTEKLYVGLAPSGTAFNGYIQDIRITKGYARYVVGTGGNNGRMVFNGTNTLALPTKSFASA